MMSSIFSFIEKIAWPLVALIFGIIFILIFRKGIQEFIGRVKSVGKDGLTTELATRSQTEAKRKENVEELMRLEDSPLLHETEQLIYQDLKKRDMDTNVDTVKVLIRHLAATQLALDFEQIYNLIFGGQIFLLKKLNEVTALGIEEVWIGGHFSNIQKMFPDNFNTWTLDQYLSFLINRRLIIKRNDSYLITTRGVEFLVWMTKTGRSERRPF